MNQLINHPQFGTVRVETINNEPWFVGKDLCEAFGDSNFRRTLANLDADEKAQLNQFVKDNFSLNEKDIEAKVEAGLSVAIELCDLLKLGGS